MEETPQNPHLKTYIVLGTMVVVAIIILATIWGIMGGSLGTSISKEEQAVLEQKALEDTKAAAQKALLAKQAAEMDKIRQERGLATTTVKQIKQQAAAMDQIRKKRGLTAPTQQDLQQQAQEIDALRALMK